MSPTRTLDAFAARVAESAPEDWAPLLLDHVAAEAGGGAAALLVAHERDALHVLASRGRTLPHPPPGEIGAPRSEEGCRLLPLAGPPSALLIVEGEGEADALAMKVAGWLAVASLGLARQQQRSALRRQAEARDHFFSMVNHDLKGPLASVKALSDLVLRKVERGTLDLSTESGQEDLLDRLRLLSGRVADMARLIDTIGEISQIERGRLQIQSRRGELCAILRQLTDQFADQETHPIVVTLPDEPLYFQGDPRRIEQLFHHLLDNAARYSPADTEIRLQVTLDDGQVRVEIEDEGEGIEPDRMARLLHEYGHGIQSGSAGLGIGLYLANAVAVAHGGRILLESRPGRGTHVTTILPLGGNGDEGFTDEG